MLIIHDVWILNPYNIHEVNQVVHRVSQGTESDLYVLALNMQRERENEVPLEP